MKSRILTMFICICITVTLITPAFADNTCGSNVDTSTKCININTVENGNIKGNGCTCYKVVLNQDTKVNVIIDITSGDAYKYDMITIINSNGSAKEYHNMTESNCYTVSLKAGTSYIGFTSWYGSEYSYSIMVTPIEVIERSQKIKINNESVLAKAYLINGSNYIKLRDIAQMMNDTDKEFNVTWNADTNTVNIIKDHAYEPDKSAVCKLLDENDNAACCLCKSKISVDNNNI